MYVGVPTAEQMPYVVLTGPDFERDPGRVTIRCQPGKELGHGCGVKRARQVEAGEDPLTVAMHPGHSVRAS